MKSNIILGNQCSVNLFFDDGTKQSIPVDTTLAIELMDMRNNSIENFHDYVRTFLIKKDS